MRVNELFVNESSIIEPGPKGYSSEGDDQSILKLSDMRKTRLTLGQLQKLRQMNDVKAIEHEQKLKSLATQYRPPVQDAAGMGM